MKNPNAHRATFALASIFGLRLIGLFMILPIFSLYAVHLNGATPTLVGLALGIYGLTQGLLQIPFGMWSDRIGRKPVITLGLLCFCIGSLLVAISHSITMVIIGRALQGAGAVGSTTIALVADLTQPSQRTKAMAIIGITIGLSFTVAMILGPLLNVWLSIPTLFWLITGFGLLALVILHVGVPAPNQSATHLQGRQLLQECKNLLLDNQLTQLNIGIFIMHAIFTASFIAIPIDLQNTVGLTVTQQWHVYVPALLLASISVIPLITLAEKYRYTETLFIVAITGLAAAQLGGLFLYQTVIGSSFNLFLFFLTFTVLEALLPSFVSKLAPAQSRGTAMGIYSSSQFLGIFVGGVVGGWLYGHYTTIGLFFATTLSALIWLVIAKDMQHAPMDKIEESEFI